MKKNKKHLKTLADKILLILMTISAFYFILEVYLGSLVPFKYRVIAIAILLITIMIFAFWIIITKNGSWLRRVLLVVLSGLLISGGIFQYRIRHAFNSVDNGLENIDRAYLVALVDESLTNASDINGSEILSFSSGDEALIAFAQLELHDENFTYVESDDLVSTVQSLINGEYKAALMSHRAYSNLKVNYNDLYKQLMILDQVEMRISNTEVGSAKDITSEPFTVYISGMDSLGVPNYNGLSDVNMLLMVDPLRHVIDMVSIPRDSYIPNLAYNGLPDKLTHTGNVGIDNVVQSMEQVFGFDIDYYAKVSFSSLIEIVDALGGISVDVQLEFVEQDENRLYTDYVHLWPGVQTLNGRQALAYARHRHTEGWGDLGRNFAQQQIIQGIINKMMTPDGITKVADVLNIGAQYVSTNMPISTVKGFVNNEIAHIRPWTFTSTSLANAVGTQLGCASAMDFGPLFVFLLDENEIADVYNKYMNMYEQEQMSDFKFDMNDLNKYKLDPPYNPNLITWQNSEIMLNGKFSSMVISKPEIEEIEQGEEESDVSDEEKADAEKNEEGEVVDYPDAGSEENDPIENNLPEENLPVDETGPLDPSADTE